MLTTIPVPEIGYLLLFCPDGPLTFTQLWKTSIKRARERETGNGDTFFKILT